MTSESSPPEPITLVEITRETVGAILALKVHDAQRNFVADNARSIAQAHFDPKAWFRAIYIGETAVGFIMLHDDAAEKQYFLWRLMIDGRYQRRGYARQAIDRLIDYVKTRPGADSLLVSCVPGEGSPLPFYEKYGFVLTGQELEGELVLKLPLTRVN